MDRFDRAIGINTVERSMNSVEPGQVGVAHQV